MYCVKFLLTHNAHRAALMSIFLALSQAPVYTAKPRIQTSASCGVPDYVPAFAGTHCTYQRRDGQAELRWVAGYILRWFTRPLMVTHPSTNRARRWLTLLMQPTTLRTKPLYISAQLPWFVSNLELWQSNTQDSPLNQITYTRLLVLYWYS